jgi:hypothetical protein
LTRTDPLARVVFALLVVACFVAFFVTQRLKHTPTVIQRVELTPRFSPSPRGHIKHEAISFKLTRADAVTVMVIDSAGNIVATLVQNRPVPRYKQFSLRWNGRRGTAHRFGTITTEAGRTILVPVTVGRLAPPGDYHVRVILRQQQRTVNLPRSFALVGG